jgi:hypothetical protein
VLGPSTDEYRSVTAAGKQKKKPSPLGKVHAVAASSSNENEVATCGSDGVLRIWDTDARLCIISMQLAEECELHALAYSYDVRGVVHLAVGMRSCVVILNASNQLNPLPQVSLAVLCKPFWLVVCVRSACGCIGVNCVCLMCALCVCGICTKRTTVTRLMHNDQLYVSIKTYLNVSMNRFVQKGSKSTVFGMYVHQQHFKQLYLRLKQVTQ